MYKKFSVNIGSGKDKADAPPDRKRKDPQKLLMLFAFVFAVVMAAGIIAILAIAKRMVGSDYIERNNAPLAAAIAVTIVGGVMMALFIVISVILLVKESENEAVASSSDVQVVVDPSVLKDPRIKQLPELQRLMQYASVQMAFFEGKFPDDPKAASDPYLQELVTVLSQLADENGVIRL